MLREFIEISPQQRATEISGKKIKLLKVVNNRRFFSRNYISTLK